MATNRVAKKVRISTTGDSVDLVVGAHHTRHLPFHHTSLEGNIVRVLQVLLAHLSNPHGRSDEEESSGGRYDTATAILATRACLGIEVEAVDPLPVVEVVGGVVLAAGGDLEAGMAAAAVCLLEAADVGGSVAGGHGGVFAGGLLAAAPPWVPVYVHVGAPKRQPGLASVVHGPSLVRHNLPQISSSSSSHHIRLLWATYTATKESEEENGEQHIGHRQQRIGTVKRQLMDLDRELKRELNLLWWLLNPPQKSGRKTGAPPNAHPSPIMSLQHPTHMAFSSVANPTMGQWFVRKNWKIAAT